MAFILSDYIKSDNNDCISQHFLKFDPKTVTAHPSAWTKKLSGMSSNKCGHLGLVFGRRESFLYAFSLFNSQSTVSLLDTSGNSIW
jgi:hypothetical protein